MADDRCPVTELLPTECAHCRRVELPTAVQRPFGRPFRAAYPGSCSDCGGRFGADDWIRADGDGGYVHDDCAET